jgi:hypothetical protein
MTTKPPIKRNRSSMMYLLTSSMAIPSYPRQQFEEDIVSECRDIDLACGRRRTRRDGFYGRPTRAAE